MFWKTNLLKTPSKLIPGIAMKGTRNTHSQGATKNQNDKDAFHYQDHGVAWLSVLGRYVSFDGFHSRTSPTCWWVRCHRQLRGISGSCFSLAPVQKDQNLHLSFLRTQTFLKRCFVPGLTFFGFCMMHACLFLIQAQSLWHSFPVWGKSRASFCRELNWWSASCVLVFRTKMS